MPHDFEADLAAHEAEITGEPISAADIIQPMIANLERLLEAKFPGRHGSCCAMLHVSPRKLKITLGNPGGMQEFEGQTFAKALDAAIEWVTRDDLIECNLTLGLNADGTLPDAMRGLPEMTGVGRWLFQHFDDPDRHSDEYLEAIEEYGTEKRYIERMAGNGYRCAGDETSD